MRYDDRLSTILAAVPRDGPTRAALWLQLVDLVAQLGGDALPSDAALSRLSAWRRDVSEPRRRAAAAAIAGKRVPAALVECFAGDSALVAAPLLMRAPLEDAQWLAMIPSFPPAARALLRERRDLSGAVLAMLRAYGSSDFALPEREADDADVLLLDTPVAEPEPVESIAVAPPAVALAGEPAPIAISELVRRIERFRRDRPAAAPAARDRIESFAFETDLDGLIHWVDGAPRAPLIGLSIAQMAEPGGYGVDGQAAGAFRQRSAIRDARLRLPGIGPVAGDWLLSANPSFAAQTGRFEGFRGVGRRLPTPAIELPEGLVGGMRPDSIRQLVHELRTPLNAIRGFAEMIDGQFLGPAPYRYRTRAQAIIADSEDLLTVIDSIDIAARLESNALAPEPPAATDLRPLLAAAAAHPALAAFGIRLTDAGMPLAVAASSEAARWLVAQLLRLGAGVAATDEALEMKLLERQAMVILSLRRPRALVGLSESDLLDADAERGTEALVPLGFGFTARLIDRYARALGGRLMIDDDGFDLILPPAQASSGGLREGQ